MVDVASPIAPDTGTTVMVTRAVSQLWWGAMFCLIDLTVSGWDLVSDVIGIVLVTLACRTLVRIDPRDPVARAGLVLAVAALIATVLYSVPALRDIFPTAELIASVIAQVGIVVVAAHLASRLLQMGHEEIARRWRLAAVWQAATTATMVVFLASASIVGGFDIDANSDAVFDWAIDDSNVGLVILVVSLAIGTIAGALWLRAAWTVWRRLP